MSALDSASLRLQLACALHALRVGLMPLGTVWEVRIAGPRDEWAVSVVRVGSVA